MAQQSLSFTNMSESLEAKSNQQDIRQLPNIPSNIWKDTHLFTSDINSDRILDFDGIYGRQIEKLKDEVKGMLVAATNDPIEKVIDLINSLCQLGVSYHFQAEIEMQLNQIFESQCNFNDENDNDLYTTSLLFRILRQHGYQMACSNFNKFKDSDGKFKETLASDAKGMLSLYEATYLRLHGEDILEEALAFSMAHLKSLAEKLLSPHLVKQITNALELPLHKSMPRLEALKFISFYEQEESRSETLLLFAKLDFNQVQLLHQQELSHLTSWWKDLDLPSKLPYTRDRVIEAYLWTVMMYFEPCYSRARLILCKITMLLTVVDDTYDSYGTIEELRLFAYAIRRWDISALDDLPEYMQLIYSTLLDFFDEINNDLTEKERSYRVSYVKDMVKKMFEAYFVEARWWNQNYVPPFDEYYKNAFVSLGSFAYTAASFLGMGEETAEINSFDWLRNQPKILSAAYGVARLKNDIMSHKLDEKRDHIICSVECYMKEYGLSMEETAEKYNIVFENAWKDMNMECMKPTPVSMDILLRIVNLARLAEITYKDGDGFTHPQKFKDTISSLFIDQIPI